MTSDEFMKAFNKYSDENFYASSEEGLHIYKGFSAFVFETEVNWGDWKHEHGRLDYLVEKFCKENGLVFALKGQEVTEEDGGDAYSAIHWYLISGLEV